jgi:hypothetical protein
MVLLFVVVNQNPELSSFILGVASDGLVLLHFDGESDWAFVILCNRIGFGH